MKVFLQCLPYKVPGFFHAIFNDTTFRVFWVILLKEEILNSYPNVFHVDPCSGTLLSTIDGPSCNKLGRTTASHADQTQVLRGTRRLCLSRLTSKSVFKIFTLTVLQLLLFLLSSQVTFIRKQAHYQLYLTQKHQW